MAWNGSYPTSAAQMAAAVGNGTWSAGWLLNEASGNLAAAFGSPTLTAGGGGATYSAAGPLGGADTAVTFDNGTGTTNFSGGNVFDPGASGGNDVVVFMVVSQPGTGGFSESVVGKMDSSTNAGWSFHTITTTQWELQVRDGSGISGSVNVTGFTSSTWWVVGVVVDRGTNKINLARIDETGSAVVAGESSLAGVGTLSTSANFKLGALDTATWGTCPDMTVAAMYVAHGTGAAGSMGTDATLSTAITNFRNALRDAAGGTSKNLLLLGVG